MILMKNRIEEILKPGVIVAHFQREEALKKEGTDPNAFLYQVCGIATNTETEGHVVIYQALYGDHEIFVRPLEEFIGTHKATIMSIKTYTPRFTIYTDPVDVTPDAQAAGIIEKESDEIKKLRKKVKRLQSDLKKARKEVGESVKKPASKKQPTNKNDGILNKGIEYTGGVEVPVVYTGTSAIDPKINDVVKSTNIMGPTYHAVSSSTLPSDVAVSESEEAEESARFLAHKKASK